MDIRKFSDIEKQVALFVDRNSKELDRETVAFINYIVNRSKEITTSSSVASLSDEELYEAKRALEKKIREEKEKNRIELIKISREYGYPCYVEATNKPLIREVMLTLLENERKECESAQDSFSSQFRIKTETVHVYPNAISDLADMDSYGFISCSDDIESKIF